jgi:hypothetical protein
MFMTPARSAGVHHAGYSRPHVGHHVHDGAAVFLQGMLVGGLRHPPGAVQVGVDHGSPALGLELTGRHRKLPARVVHDAVEPTVLGDDARDGFIDGLRVADVQDGVVGFSAGFLDLADDLEERLLLATRNDCSRTERGQLVSDATSNPGAATRYEDDLSGEEAGPEDAVEARSCHAVCSFVFCSRAVSVMRPDESYCAVVAR